MATKNDWDEAVKAVDAHKPADNLSPTQSTTDTQSATQSVNPQPNASNLGGSQSSVTATTTSSATTSSATGTQSSTPITSSNPEFTIAIFNPTSEASKKVSGTVTIGRQGPLYTATGIISGFPDGGLIGPISGQPSGGGGEYRSNEYYKLIDSLLQEVLNNLENEIISKYQVQVKLVAVDSRGY